MPNIIVCMKVIFDPEIPSSLFKIDSVNKKPVPPRGMTPVFSPFDENALEAALKIKDEQDWTVTLLCMGKSIPKAILQKGMALGADEVVAVEGEEFEDLDSFTTAQALADAIRKIDNYDLIFTGRQSADWDAGIVWAGISELLDIPGITIARKIEIQDNAVWVERCASDGIETIKAKMPALITVSSEAGELRFVGLKDLMKAKKRQYTKWSVSEVKINKNNAVTLMDLYEPDLASFNCQMIQGDSGQERGKNLARKLIADGILA